MNRKLALVLSSLVAAAVAVAVAAADAGAPPGKPGSPAGKAAASGARSAGAATTAKPATDPAALPLLVEPAWLAAHLDDPALVLLHVGDAEAYRERHIRGARYVTLADVSVTGPMGEGLVLELPPAGELRRRLEGLGISDDSRVIVYFGEDWVSPATRLVLTLDAAGLGGHTALLDGGMPAWLRAGHPVSDAATPARQGKLAPLAMKPIIVDATVVLASLGKPGVAVVDARDRVFYDGAKIGGMPGHLHRAGHIAGALSIPFTSVVDDRNLLRSPDELRALFNQAGVAPGDTVIGYCHIGQQATAMLLAARRLGHPVLLYDGAFEDWSLFHPGYPVERSPVPAPAKQPEAPAPAPARQPAISPAKMPPRAAAAAEQKP